MTLRSALSNEGAGPAVMSNAKNDNTIQTIVGMYTRITMCQEGERDKAESECNVCIGQEQRLEHIHMGTEFMPFLLHRAMTVTLTLGKCFVFRTIAGVSNTSTSNRDKTGSIVQTDRLFVL